MDGAPHGGWSVAAAVLALPMAAAAFASGRCCAGDWLVGRGFVDAATWGLAPAAYFALSLWLAGRTQGARRGLAMAGALMCGLGFVVALSAGAAHYPFG